MAMLLKPLKLDEDDDCYLSGFLLASFQGQLLD